MTPLGKRLLALLLSLAAAAALLEVALRLIPEPPAYADTSVDNVFDGYRLPEGWQRQRESPGIVRVLVLGDSFTWGDGVRQEDAYPHRLQHRLNLADPERRFRVLNAGRNGLNTAAQLEQIDRLQLLVSDPDLVVVGFTLNDPEPRSRVEAEAMKEETWRRLPPGRAELELYARSHLFRLVWDRLENSRQRRAFDRYVAALFDPRSSHWRECVEALEALRDLFAGRGVPLLVAVLPAFDSPFDERYPYRAQHEQILETLARLGIEGIDLWPLYEGVETRRLVVTPFTDAHPNELGHRIAADFLALKVGQCLSVTFDEAGRSRRWRCPEEG